MSKVPYTIDVNRYVCSELELLRKAHETRDYSSVPSIVERIQFHVNAMEEGLYRIYKEDRAVSKAWDKEVSDEEFRKLMKKAFKKRKGKLLD